MMSPAGSEHGRIAARLGRSLGNHVDNKRLGETYAAETGFLITSNPDTVRAPDAAFVSKELLASIEPTTGYLPIAPTLVIEVRFAQRLLRRSRRKSSVVAFRRD